MRSILLAAPLLGHAPAARAEHNYRTQLIIADAVATAAVVGGAIAMDGHVKDEAAIPFIAGGIATYFLASPVLHAIHGQRGNSFKSIGLRTAPLLVTAVALGVVSGVGDCELYADHSGIARTCSSSATAAGLLVGAASIPAAMGLDWYFLGTKAEDQAIVTVHRRDGGTFFGIARPW